MQYLTSVVGLLPGAAAILYNTVPIFSGIFYQTKAQEHKIIKRVLL